MKEHTPVRVLLFAIIFTLLAGIMPAQKKVDAWFSGKADMYKAKKTSPAPWSGRSALDGVDLVNVDTDYLREHLFYAYRLHYVVTEGGEAPPLDPNRELMEKARDAMSVVPEKLIDLK